MTSRRGGPCCYNVASETDGVMRLADMDHHAGTKLNTAKSHLVGNIRGWLRRWRRPLVFLLCVQSLAGAGAQHLSEPQFVQTLTNNSIMDGVVTAVAQDAQGYIWAGGATGLARYDAYQFVRFPLKEHAGDAEVISNVAPITAGRDGRLWLGVASVGLVALDPRTGLSVFYRHDPKNPHSLAGAAVRAIVADGAGGFWVGMQGGGLDHFHPATGRFEHVRVADGGLPDGNVSALLLDRRGDLWVGTGKGLVRKARAADRYLQVLRDPQDQARLARQTVSRLREDRAGRLWIGTMDNQLHRPNGALYRVTGDGQVTRIFGDVIVTNGIAFAPDNRTLYFTDTRRYRTWAFDFDLDHGVIGNRRLFADYNASGERPDGACVDVDGGLWTAFFSGGRIARYRPDGQIDTVIPLPVTNPTCLCFGGDDLKTLYVTTARKFLDPQRLSIEPEAGHLLAIHGVAQGLPEHRFSISGIVD